ncbi:MAG TPA: hypothetical protein VEL69_07845, partial [Ktedonobacteraceae bacterium]|nr:hypothetical protein [Ktedonobacteraceae bacterium]
MKNDKLPQPPGSRQARPSQTSCDFHELQESLDAAGAADDEETQPSLRTLKRRANEQVLHPFGGNRD